MFRTVNDEKILYLDDVGDGGMFPFTVDGRNQRAYLSRTKHVGVDIVVDAVRGPLVLELNARPGLEIQNINGRGLGAALTAAGKEVA